MEPAYLAKGIAQAPQQIQAERPVLLVAACLWLDGTAANALPYLLDEPVQVGWQGHPVYVGDLGGAKLDLSPAISPHGSL